MKSYFVYIMASGRNGTLYIGVTNNLLRRVYEHKHHIQKGFTDSYNVTDLVYYEQTPEVASAIAREKQLKQWKRAWKISLIEESNPTWRDLADDLLLDSESSIASLLRLLSSAESKLSLDDREATPEWQLQQIWWVVWYENDRCLVT